MAKKQYFLIVDTETTQSNMVADFAAVIVDKKGNVVAQCAVLVREFYLDQQNHPLFHSKDADPLWGQANLPKRYDNYDAMLDKGTRMLASVNAINNWLSKVAGKYAPTLAAYNLSFDLDKCIKSGIDLTSFDRSFCLWQAAYTKWGTSKKYRQFILDNHFFKPPTAFGNMSYSTNAETMARFILGAELPDEPHTALEDIIFYELPIFKALSKTQPLAWFLNEIQPYNWRNVQVKDWFIVK
jgi:hypothetical protein